MTDHDQSAAPLVPVAIKLRGEDLVLEVSAGDKAIAAQLTPQTALELARNLLTAGLEHAERRAALHLEADKLADATVRKAAH